MINKPAPIVLFVYNRPWHTLQVLEALSKNNLANESDLYIFCDGIKTNATENDLKNKQLVHKIIAEKNWCKTATIIKGKKNKGLADSIIDGVTEIVKKHKKIIVLEDDLLPSKYFLKFINEALNKYEQTEEVACISGYIYPVKETLPETFFLKGADCWGWATWERGWDIFEYDGKKLLTELKKKKLTYSFDFNDSYSYTQMLSDQIKGKNNSWAIRWYASAFLKNKLTLYPKKSLIYNIGFDGSGTHSGKEYLIKDVSNSPIRVKTIPIIENNDVKRLIASYFKSNNSSNKNSLLRLSKKIIKKGMHLFLNQKKTIIEFENAQNSWEIAKEKTTGYDSKNILEKVKDATLKVKNKEAVFERDSVLFDKIEYSEDILKALNHIALANNNQLNVIDFGGSLGSLYYQYVNLLDSQNITWNVIEQAHFVEIGKKEISNNQLFFYENIKEVFQKEKHQVLLLSSVLQYIKNYKEKLNEILKFQFEYIIIDRTSFIEGVDEEVMIQKVPESIYNASYPIRFFNYNKFISLLRDGYDILHTFDSYCDPTLKTNENKLLYWKGFILKRKHEA